MVGGETGLAHMACAVGTPNVVVLGGGHFGRFMPYSPLTTCAILPLLCFQCDWKCPYDRAHCVKDLAPEVVTRAIRTALDAPSDKPRIVSQESWEQPWGGPDLSGGRKSESHAPVFTMVVPSTGRPERLEAMLTSATKALGGKIPWELIGICPGNDIVTQTVFRQWGARRVLFDENHLGEDGKFSWSVLMNAGFKEARGKWVMYGSDDLTFRPHSLARALAYADLAHPKLGGLAMMENNPSWPTHPKWWVPMTNDGWLMINFGLIRKAAWEAVGGFYPGFHFYGADWDLCYRIQAAGWAMFPLWDARVGHQQESDATKILHEEHWQADHDLLVARSHLRPSPKIQGCQTDRITTLEQARLFNLAVLEDQVNDGPAPAMLDRWSELVPKYGFLLALQGKDAKRTGWDIPKVPMPKLTVICAVWHKDPKRHELLAGHQACLDHQTIPVERIYVFDNGDIPPYWLKGQTVTVKRPLSLYEAWNVAVGLVRTPFVMNLNLDDRLNPDGAALIEKALKTGADLVGSDWRICYSQEETDAVGMSEPAGSLPFYPVWPPVPGMVARLGSGTGERLTMGPGVAWRMVLHQEFPRLPWQFGDGTPIRIVGDSMWWDLLMKAGKMVKRLPVIIGRYHSHPADQAEFTYSIPDELQKFKQFGLKMF